jgi:hypothetical protein
MKKTMIIALLAITGYGVAFAQLPKVITSEKEGWHKIGETRVDFQTEHSDILILGANRFSSIQIKVEDAPIDFTAAEAYYASGDKQDLKLTGSIKAPGESDLINLNGGMRTLKKIVLVYKTIPNYKDKKAHVEIWGLKTVEKM